MKLTSKGQVTIPRALREQFGLLPNTQVTFQATERGVLIKSAAGERRRRLETWLKRARGTSTAKLSTAKIMSLTRGEG